MGTKGIAARLETWFATARRDMPWRREVTPYGCYLSEIMLQQTTYAGAIGHYGRFLSAFPTVEALAAAPESAVLKVWEGLGYYARARNLLKAAKRIVADGWPTTVEGWQRLPGVGPYTAASLASVLNGVRRSVVDGNVSRVFARHWALSDDFRAQGARERLAARLDREMARAKVPGDFNQAMMELGALVCTPKSPDCASCPLAATCVARREGRQADFPVRPEKKPLPVRRHAAVLVTDGEGKVLLVQNTDGGLLKGLWDLPTLDHALDYRQTFTHFRLDLSVERAKGGARFVDPATVPLTTAARKILDQLHKP
ncbi:MAG: A/G-specific adenine glycosylase [Kiritimatiellae bacterium]|nr:A/G-specific adenine glycosylase [Kiritimatiellia bacterium]